SRRLRRRRHCVPATGAARRRGNVRNVFGAGGGGQFVVLPSVPAILLSGLCERQSDTASVANAAAQTLRHLEPIFIHRHGPPWGPMTYSYENERAGNCRASSSGWMLS